MAQIAAIKALDETGSGTTSDILAAMQWIAENKDKYNIKVVNLSLGISADARNPIDPLVIGAAALVARGVTVVTAAGNSGPEPCTVTSPGTSPFVITVGSCDERGRITEFSGRGPTFSGLHKPDLVAPGVDIVSLDAATCKGYIAQSGTSMSSPYAAGIVALSVLRKSENNTASGKKHSFQNANASSGCTARHPRPRRTLYIIHYYFL